MAGGPLGLLKVPLKDLCTTPLAVGPKLGTFNGQGPFMVIAPLEGPHTTTTPAVGPKPGTFIYQGNYKGEGPSLEGNYE